MKSSFLQLTPGISYGMLLKGIDGKILQMNNVLVQFPSVWCVLYRSYGVDEWHWDATGDLVSKPWSQKALVELFSATEPIVSYIEIRKASIYNWKNKWQARIDTFHASFAIGACKHASGQNIFQEVLIPEVFERADRVIAYQR